jgi:hypothetical protein
MLVYSDGTLFCMLNLITCKNEKKRTHQIAQELICPEQESREKR